MAFSDMNDVEQELGEENPPESNGNRTFLIIAGILGGIMVLALLCIAGLAIYRYLPGQRGAQEITVTQAAQQTLVAVSAKQTAFVPVATSTKLPTFTPTNIPAPTNTPLPTSTPVVVLVPTKSPTPDVAVATRDAHLTQTAVHLLATLVTGPQATATQEALLTQTAVHPLVTVTTNPQATSSAKPTSTALPGTGIADELGSPGLLAVGFMLVVVIFFVRKLRTAS